MIEGLLGGEFGLGEEFVGVADDLFLDGFGQEVLWGNGQVLRDDVLKGESCSSVSFTHAGVARKSFASQRTGEWPVGRYESTWAP